MKKLWIAASICILFCGGIFIYTEWEKKEFVKNLPALPQEFENTSQQDLSPAKVENNSTVISKNRQKSDGFKTKIENEARLEQTSNEDIWQTNQDSYDGNSDPILSLEDIWQTNQDSYDGNSDPILSPPMALQDASVSFTDLSPEEKLEVKYKMLLEQWGNIPEVQTYFELGKKRLHNNLTLEENIVRTEAILYLFPSERTEKSLMLMKWQKSQGPDFQFNLNDPGLMRELKSMGVKKVERNGFTFYTIE
ncbi:MAG: hypothetical protein OXN25_19990 [Candidatus Poribacteria bacterium]|nr:hypothetical protein [Candidatus Poribacteria bacterium]